MAICDKCSTEYSALSGKNCPKCKNRGWGGKAVDVANDVGNTISKIFT